MLIEKIERKKQQKNTFNNVAYEWLENKNNKIKSSTYIMYKYIIDRYSKTEIGNLSLKELEKYNFESFVSEINKKFAPKTAKDLLTILRSILCYANEMYSTKIKTKTIVNPKQNKKPLKILSKDEQKRIEQTCMEINTLKSLGIVICLNTGLRIGEICALKWENIDLDRKEIRVRKTLERLYDSKEKTIIIIDTPKSQNSVRDIPMSRKLYSILSKMKNKYSEEDYFLTGKEDKFIEPGNYRAYFERILKKSKIKHKYKFHILRHTFATNCIGVGMDIKTLSEILGHSNVEITLNKYVHSSYETKKKFLEKL